MWMALIAMCLALGGCTDHVQLPSTEQLVEFHSTGSAGPAVDLTRVTRARLETGPYLVRPEEALELTMPMVLQIVTSEAPEPSKEMTPYICRVSETGTIALPAVGEISVAGKSTAQIEATVATAYFPKFTTTRPSVYVRILEHKTHRVSITGAVKEPGLYDLRADKMSLVALIMEAKGITEDGAAVIRISHPEGPVSAGTSGPDREYARITSPAPIPAMLYGTAPPPASDSHTLLLPVRGLNIPFVDIALQEGDAVVVEPLVVSFVSEITDQLEQRREEFAQLNEKLTEYTHLQSEYEQTRRLCDILDERIKELNISEETGAMNISILEVARPADEPFAPQRTKVLAMATGLGMVLGAGLALLRQMLDQRLKSVLEID